MMQPGGDKFGAVAERSAAVCPWIGRDWRRRMYGGNGPLWPGYFHFYEDAEHLEVAEMMGCMWWRDDIAQYHDHHLRHDLPEPPHMAAKGPVSLLSRKLFLERQAAGFPGHEPIP